MQKKLALFLENREIILCYYGRLVIVTTSNFFYTNGVFVGCSVEAFCLILLSLLKPIIILTQI